MFKGEQPVVHQAEAEDSVDTSWVDLAEGSAKQETQEEPRTVSVENPMTKEEDEQHARALLSEIQNGKFDGVAVSEAQKDMELRIKTAMSLQGVFSALDAAGTIESSQQSYSAQEVKELINGVFSGQESLHAITRNHGLREVVEALYYSKNAQSFDQLYHFIKKVDSIQGGSKSYSPDELIDIIEKVRSNGLSLTYVTSTYGMRDAVERLLKNEGTI